MKHLLLLLSIATLFTACKKDEICTEVDYDTLFTIEPESSYCFPDDLELTVDKIDNAFCPCDSQCIWEGEMTISMTWTYTSGSRAGETVTYLHHSASTVVENEMILDGIEVITNDEDIVFRSPCSESNPSPDITATKIRVVK